MPSQFPEKSSSEVLEDEIRRIVREEIRNPKNQATIAQNGTVTLASSVEVLAGKSDNCAVTPATLEMWEAMQRARSVGRNS